MKRALGSVMTILVLIILVNNTCLGEEWKHLSQNTKFTKLYTLCIERASDYENCLMNTNGLCFMENETICENLQSIVEIVDFDKPDYMICLLPASTFSLLEWLERENESQQYAVTYVIESAFSVAELLSSKSHAEIMRRTSLINMTNEIESIEVSYNLLIYNDQPFEILVSTIGIDDSSIIFTSIIWLDEETLQTPWSFAYEMAMRWGLDTSFQTTVIDCRGHKAITYSGEPSGAFLSKTE